MKTTIDWFKFRCKVNPFELFDLIRPAFGTVGFMLELRTGVKGRDGWLFGADVVLPDTCTIAHIDYGGDSQKGWVRFDMSGEGCGWVQDWAAVEALEDRFGLNDCDIKRIDIAFTTSDPTVASDAIVVAAFDAGMFACGGRPPAMRSHTSTDPCAGKTRYIGKRESHKFLRCYEKGWELLKDLPRCAEFLKKPGVSMAVDHLGVVKAADLYRVELELKDVDKYIPWTVIGRRDDVFSGAYPFCGSLLPDAPHFVMSEMPSFKPKAAVLKAMSNMFSAYGGIWKAVHLAYGGGDEVLMEMARFMDTADPSRRLVDAGVLTVDHEPIWVEHV